jgi:hypothetical protein
MHRPDEARHAGRARSLGLQINVQTPAPKRRHSHFNHVQKATLIIGTDPFLLGHNVTKSCGWQRAMSFLQSIFHASSSTLVA